jgi:guanine deaminase
VSSAPVTRFRARILHALGPDRVEEFADGALAIDADGRILSCGPFDPAQKGRCIEFPGKLLIPGLVDLHCHIPQLDARGKHGATLLEWLDRYIFPAENAFADLRVVDDVATRFFKKLILNGTTTSSLYATVHAAATARCFEIAEAAGVRCAIGKVMMDRNAPEGLLEATSASLDESERLCRTWHGAAGGRLRYAVTPRYIPTCSRELWKGAGRLAEESGCLLQSHVAETREENALIRELHPELPDVIAFFEEVGCLSPRTILAHAIHLTDGECRRLAATGARVAHCPVANFFLKSGQMSVAQMEASGVAYGLGTDVGAGTSMSLFTVMRHADYTQLAASISPQKAFFLATLGGARALSMEGEVGSFEAGKFADFCIVDIAGIDPTYRLPDLAADEVLSLLMYRGDSRAIEATYVAGKRLDVDAI